ncbi:UNVERIFIED_CONTAM: hypothetical protein HDU68_006193 [Siphonaria sp. JEL0065]|nr:hypothetical protein HDU68_006193 [Siphonaria sp. JEL0065]
MDEETIIRNKLAVDQRPLKKLMRKFQLLAHSVHSKQDDASRAQALESFLIDLATYSTTVLHKQHQIQLMNTIQQSHFSSDFDTVSADIEQTKIDIERLKLELIHENKKRAEMLEYDQVAKSVLEFPSREETEG